MPEAARFLGFAFATADLLLEIDGAGTVIFAIGASRDFVSGGSESLIGSPAALLFAPADARKFTDFGQTLQQGARAGPFPLKLANGAETSVSMFRVPQNGDRISCTLAKPGIRQVVKAGTDAKTGLASRDAFLEVAAKVSSETDLLTLVDLPGLPELCAKLPVAKADALLARIGAAIANSGAKAAARISDSSFAAISDQAKAGLAGHIRDAVGGDAAALEIEETQIAMRGRRLSPEQRVLAVRYVVDRFTKDAQDYSAGGDLSQTFAAMMDETQQRLNDLTESVKGGSFKLAFQPIVSLKTGSTSHYEALVRFALGATGETVGFLEALGVADALDLAVAVKVIAALDAEPDKSVQFALNVSGQTLESAAKFGMLAEILARNRRLAKRLLIEITESALITNLDAAVKAANAVREMGYRVGLDDFGAGAATLNYLHAFTVDFVKFDGSLVKKMGTSQRDDALLRGMVKLCTDLGIQTVAEYIETADQVQRAREIGFDYGQGYFWGAGSETIAPPQTQALRRKGEKVEWG